MTDISRRQFIRISATVGLGALFSALAPGKEAAAQPRVAAPGAWPLGAVPREQTLVYYGNRTNGVIPSMFNPLSPLYDHQNGNALLYEPCAFFNPLSNATIPWLAESYQYNPSATELTIVFRSGIQWSDGSAFTSEDVIWTILALKNNDPLANRANIASKVIDAVALDSRTVKITLNQADWRFFSDVFTFQFDKGDVAFVPKSVFGALPTDQLPGLPYYDLALQWPISTGPYGVGERVDGAYVNYDRRPSWWAVTSGFVQHMPEVARVQTQLYINDNTAINKFLSNQADIGVDISPTNIKNILDHNVWVTTWTGKQSPYGHTDWWPISVYFNNLRPPFNDKRVRWAVAYAIDQQAIIDNTWGGAGSVTGHPYPVFPHLMTYISGINGINDLLAAHNVLTHDLAQTTALMTAAGFAKDSEGYWADSHGRLKADLYATNVIFADIAPVIAQQLRTAGFDCNHVSPATVMDDMADGTASLFLFGHGGSTYDPLATFNLYRPENIQPIGSPSWGNLARWSNPGLTSAANQMAALPPDDPAMTPLFRTGMAIWLDELPDCPVCQWTQRIPLNTRFWTNFPSQSHAYCTPTMWSKTALLLVVNLKMARNTYLPAVSR